MSVLPFGGISYRRELKKGLITIIQLRFKISLGILIDHFGSVEMTSTTSTTSEAPVSGEVDLALSILTILTTLCQASTPKKMESLECKKAQADLLNLASAQSTPWVIRGSTNVVPTELEKGLLAFIGQSGTAAQDFGLSRREALRYSGFNWSAFFKNIQGLFSVASKLKDPLDFVKEIKDYLLRDSDVSVDKLKVFLDLHQVDQITEVLSAIHQAETKVTYIIVALIIFLVLTTVIWLALNIRSYCEQKQMRKAQKASRQAGVMLREMQVARRNQLAGIPSHALL